MSVSKKGLECSGCWDQVPFPLSLSSLHPFFPPPLLPLPHPSFLLPPSTLHLLSSPPLHFHLFTFSPVGFLSLLFFIFLSLPLPHAS